MIDSNDNLSVALVEMRILKLLRKEQMTKADVNDELNSVFDACAGDPNPPVRVFHWMGPTGPVKADFIYRDGTKRSLTLEPELSKSQKQRIRQKKHKKKSKCTDS